MGGNGTFGPGAAFGVDTEGERIGVAELDGLWDVRRISGALPPLPGVRKRIDGGRGETIVVGGLGIPFDVSGLELRYRRPLSFLVDVLARDGDGYRGRATAFGATYGEFELRRIR
jgi:hypothetical protein